MYTRRRSRHLEYCGILSELSGNFHTASIPSDFRANFISMRVRVAWITLIFRPAFLFVPWQYRNMNYSSALTYKLQMNDSWYCFTKSSYPQHRYQMNAYHSCHAWNLCMPSKNNTLYRQNFAVVMRFRNIPLACMNPVLMKLSKKVVNWYNNNFIRLQYITYNSHWQYFRRSLNFSSKISRFRVN